LKISNATNAPNIWDTQYGNNSCIGNFPAEVIAIDTAGLMCPPETGCATNLTKARAPPIANGLLVTNTTYMKNIAPMNSVK